MHVTLKNVGGARRFHVRLLLQPIPYVHHLLTLTLGSKGVWRARRLQVGFRLTFYLPSTKMGPRGLITTLASNNAVVLKADKGNRIVVCYVNEYYSKPQQFIFNNQFSTVENDPTNTFQKET